MQNQYNEIFPCKFINQYVLKLLEEIVLIDKSFGNMC